MTRYLAAIAFLTRIPFRRAFDAADVGRAAILFPLVGAGVGLIQVGLVKLVSPRLTSFVAAVLLVAFSAWLTRALHLDGLADFADGLAGGRSPEEALRIMRDPRTGSFGVVTAVVVVALQIAALEALIATDALVAALVLGPALSRWAAVPLSFFLPYARKEEGLGSVLTAHVRITELVGATVVAVALAAFFPFRFVALVWGSVLIVTGVVGGIALRRLGGVTGDVLGANVELSQAAAWVAAVAVSS